MSEGVTDPIRLAMKQQVVEHRKKLLQIKEGETVQVKFNGEVWDGTVSAIREHNLSLPDFRLRFPEDRSSYWVAGVQIVIN